MYAKAGGLSGPKYGFGTDDRFQRLGRRLSYAADLPGPGSYSSDSTLGSQRSSRLTTQPAFGFGTSNREHLARIFVSDMHAKSGAAVACVCPITLPQSRLLGAAEHFTPPCLVHRPASIGAGAGRRHHATIHLGTRANKRSCSAIHRQVRGEPGPGRVLIELVHRRASYLAWP